MSGKTVAEDKDMSLAELDPEQLTDSDKLYHMAQAMRDDEYFEVPIVDWEKKNDAVQVTIITPSGDTAIVNESWPEKPTTENNFIRTCMCALNIDSAKDAALMADDLQNVDHSDFTVPADKSEYNGWELKPSEEMPESTSEQVRKWLDKISHGESSASKTDKLMGLIGGPISIILYTIANRFNEPSLWWDEDTSAIERFAYVQEMWYSIIGTMVWAIAAFFVFL